MSICMEMKKKRRWHCLNNAEEKKGAQKKKIHVEGKEGERKKGPKLERGN